MKRTKFRTKFNAFLSDLRKDTRASLSNFVKFEFRGLNHFHNDLDLPFLYDNVRQCEFANMHEQFASTLPFIDLFKAIFRKLCSSVRVLFASKCIDKPIDKTFVGAADNQICGVLRSSSVSIFIGTAGKSSFTIYDSSHIGADSIRIGFSSIFKSHIIPLINVYGYVYHNIIKVQSQRLSERAFLHGCKREAIV